MTKERALIKAQKYREWADKAEQKSKSIMDKFNKDYDQFDWTEPIKIGHHSEKRHRKVEEFNNTHCELVVSEYCE